MLKWSNKKENRKNLKFYNFKKKKNMYLKRKKVFFSSILLKN